MLKTHSLSFSYNTQNSFSFPDINLDDTDHLLILGESGIGKTTLLHLMAGLLKPESGSIELNGTKINDLSSARLDRFRGQNIGLVFQRPHFVESLTVQKNLTLVQYLAGRPQESDRITALLDNLGILHKLKENPRRLSQGEQQRVAIAIAVIN